MFENRGLTVYFYRKVSSALKSCRIQIRVSTRLHHLKSHDYSTLVGNFGLHEDSSHILQFKTVLITYCISRIAVLFSFQLVRKHRYYNKCCYFKMHSIGLHSRDCRDYRVKLQSLTSHKATNKMLPSVIIFYKQ